MKHKKKTLLISFLDKSGVPNHSFVNGVLASSLPSELGFSSLIFTSRDGGKFAGVSRYRRAVLAAVLAERRGLGRFINYFIVRVILRQILKKASLTERELVLFVRNCPILLKAADDAISSNKNTNVRLVFQSSFPHEISEKFNLKSWLAISAYKRCVNVSSVTAVSDSGLERVLRYFPNTKVHEVIPLLSDFKNVKVLRPAQSPIRCVYIGTGSRERNLDLIVDVIQRLLPFRGQIEFHFYGFDESYYSQEYPSSDFKNLINMGVLSIHGSVDRERIPEILSGFDIGISIIPPTKMYLESSPTKLVEYLSQGLAIIANIEISRQKQVLDESMAGYSVRFDRTEIESAFKKIIGDTDHVTLMKKAAIQYAQHNLGYSSMKNQLSHLICK